MDRSKELALLETCLAVVRSKKPFMDRDEGMAPVAHYIDEARFEEERDQIFRQAMNVVAHSSQIAAPGDFVTRDIVGTPAILVRDDDGRARAFVNVCRHRGAMVEQRQAGHCKRFVCPYHAWTYSTDGTLHRVRHPEGFPTLPVAKTALAELSCVERGGLVWVCPDPRTRHDELDTATGQLIDEFAELCGGAAVFASDTRVWKANWKLAVDGGLESYHFRIVHRDTVAPLVGDTDSIYEFIGDHVRSILPRRSMIELEKQPRSEWSLRQHAQILYTLSPNAVILVQPRHFDLLFFTPLTADTTRVEIATVGRKPGPGGYGGKSRRYLEQNHVFTLRTLAEDFEIAEQIQRGMHTGANEHFRFGRFEGALTEWHRRLDRRLGR